MIKPSLKSLMKFSLDKIYILTYLIFKFFKNEDKFLKKNLNDDVLCYIVHAILIKEFDLSIFVVVDFINTIAKRSDLFNKNNFWIYFQN
jgi:hypothetical protein